MSEISIKENMSALLQLRSLTVTDKRERKIVTDYVDVTLFSLDGMADDKLIAENVTKPMLLYKGEQVNGVTQLINAVIFGAHCYIRNTYSEILADLFNGYALLFLDDPNVCLAVDVRVDTGRAIVQPPTSNITKGPREGFVENIKVNLTLIKKRIKTESFKQTTINVGKYTNTEVVVCYLEGVADSKTVSDIVQKITSIDIDGVIDSSYIARYLDSSKTTLFKMVGSAEKPDIVAGKMLEGRVAVFVDGSPIVLTLPYMFIEDLQSPEDYYDAPEIATMSRTLRVLSAIGSLLLPALYVSLQLYNYQIIPAKFLITILNSTKGIPFEPLSEMIVVLVLFDILREANARMPAIAGLALSIVGAVVLGDAAVKAGLLGAPAVMIGALSGIGLYTMPDNTLLLSLLRMLLTFIGGIMGLLGVLIATFVIICYLVSLSAYNTPYLAPYAPNIPHDRQDAVYKAPLTSLKKRPIAIRQKNKTRQGS